jgi:hypothetical protein
VALALYATLAHPASAIDKPTIYNAVSRAISPLDVKIQAMYGDEYRVLNVGPDEHVWEWPKRLSPNPGWAANRNGNCVQGDVVFAFIITKDGRATDAKPISSTSPELLRFALDGIKDWQMRPARLDSNAVDSVAATRYHSSCP